MGIVAMLWFFDCFVGAALTVPRGRPFFATGALLNARAAGGTGGDVFLQWLSAFHVAGVGGAPTGCCSAS